MQLVFVDETSDSKFKDYFGLCCAVVNHTKYGSIKQDFQQILINENWDTSIEFKGSYLFSAKSGDPNVSVDKRVEIAEKIVDLTISKYNARIHFTYLNSTTKDFKSCYLKNLPVLLSKGLKKSKSKQNGKNLVSIHLDRYDGISSHEIRSAIDPVLVEKGLVLVEDIVITSSNFHTVGILYADLIAYLAARIDTISNDSELFEGLTPEMAKKNGKIKKLHSSMNLIKKIKNFNGISTN